MMRKPAPWRFSTRETEANDDYAIIAAACEA
jgi:hypothetical protein